jgi:hypothetical protein
VVVEGQATTLDLGHEGLAECYLIPGDEAEPYRVAIYAMDAAGKTIAWAQLVFRGEARRVLFPRDTATLHLSRGAFESIPLVAPRGNLDLGWRRIAPK